MSGHGEGEPAVLMDTKAAKAWRASAKANQTRKKKALNLGLDNKVEEVRIRELEDEYRKAYANFEKAHDAVMLAREEEQDAAKEDEALKNEDAYVDAEYVPYNEVLDRVAVYKRDRKKEAEDANKTDFDSRLEEKRTTYLAKMMQLCDEMNRRSTTLHAELTKSAPLEVIEPLLDVAKETVARYREAASEYFDMLEPNKVAGEAKRLDNSLKDWERNCETAITYIGDLKARRDEAEATHRREVEREAAKHGAAAPVVGVATATTAPGGDNVRLERVKVPSLKKEGTCRAYPEWKRRFKAIVVPHVSKTRACEALREAIPEKHRHILRSIAYDDLDKMWEALDAKFKVPSILIDSIIQDIEKLTIPKDDSGMINLIETLELAEADLRSEGLAMEISNTTVCGKIESKLPEEWKDEWIKLLFDARNSIDAANKFPELLKFLSNLKKQLEYRAADVRKTKPPPKPDRAARGMHTEGRGDELDPNAITQDVCGQGCDKKHQLAWCPKFKKVPVSKRKSVSMQARLCFRCLEPGHRLEDCPKDWKCRNCEKENHHFLLCFKKKEKEKKNEEPSKDSNSHVGHSQKALQKEHDSHQEKPVVFQTQYVESASGEKLGLLHDGASDTNYITKECAKRLKLRELPWNLNMSGIGKIKDKNVPKVGKRKVKTPKPKENVVSEHPTKEEEASPDVRRSSRKTKKPERLGI